MLKYLKTDQKPLFLILLLIILIVSYIIIKPFIIAILASIVLAYTFYPLYKKSSKIIKNKSLRSIILLLIIMGVLLTLTFFILNLLINESVSLFHTLRNVELSNIFDPLRNLFGENVDLGLYIQETVNKGLNLILTSLSDLAFTIPQKAVSLFIILFMMYYLFKEGPSMIEKTMENLPLKKQHKETILNKLDSVMKATIYGTIVTAIIQGAIGTLGLIIFDVKSPIVWGLVMTVVSMLPYLGASIVWVPAALIKIFNNDLFNGLGLAIYGILIISLIDNLVKPKIISQKTKIHPITVLLGVIGGIQLFGFIGIFLGPVILSLIVALFEIYLTEIKQSKNEH
tara:strand:- start:14673 stop:15695 length:1023 start_codon:yes stop_codon:yes gene_type:complete